MTFAEILSPLHLPYKASPSDVCAVPAGLRAQAEDLAGCPAALGGYLPAHILPMCTPRPPVPYRAAHS